MKHNWFYNIFINYSYITKWCLNILNIIYCSQDYRLILYLYNTYMYFMCIICILYIVIQSVHFSHLLCSTVQVSKWPRTHNFDYGLVTLENVSSRQETLHVELVGAVVYFTRFYNILQLCFCCKFKIYVLDNITHLLSNCCE